MLQLMGPILRRLVPVFVEVVVTSRLPIDHWHEVIGDPSMAYISLPINLSPLRMSSTSWNRGLILETAVDRIETISPI